MTTWAGRPSIRAPAGLWCIASLAGGEDEPHRAIPGHGQPDGS